ncbi:MAG: hypothetical protein AAGG65_08125 [Pseudomonadota bacterium]
MKLRVLFVIAFSPLIVSCDLVDLGLDRYRLVNGVDPALSNYSANSLERAVAETALLEAFAVRAGVLEAEVVRQENNHEEIVVAGQLPGPGGQWHLITIAGINSVDESCERYLDALVQLRRDLTTIGRNVGLVGTTTQALMTAFTTAAETISATGAIFGLATQGIANVSDNFLFSVEPSSLRRIITSAQQAHLQYVIDNPEIYTNRPSAILGVQQYFELCLPSTIEMLINDRVSTTVFEIKEEENNNNPAPSIIQSDSAE